ncbi:MAG: NAD(P)H-quinone oxidoreductase [Myxococcales bacterium]|nr:NAD(P)H-quinone oxidoreductase [Myxococcales bacterium]
MRIVDHRQGERLLLTEAPVPEPGPGEVRIRVAAAGVNRADLMQRAGHYPPPPGASPILGLEVSGTVEAVHEGVTDLAVGDEVCALLAGGGYAEQVVCPASHTLPVPGPVSLVHAAALPEVFATAFMVLRTEGRLQPGERVLVHAGASGVGTATLQLCRAWGAPAFATAGGAHKVARCLEMGAAAAHDRHSGPWADAVAAWTPDGVDVVLDPVGGAYLADDQRVLAADGRIVVIGLLGGREARIDQGRLLVKRQRILGTTLRARSVAAKAELLSGVRRDVWPHLEQSAIQPVIHEVLPMEAADRAHQLLASNATVGKVLLTW